MDNHNRLKVSGSTPAIWLRVLTLLAVVQLAAPGGTLWLCENVVCGITACCCAQPQDPNSCDPQNAEGQHQHADGTGKANSHGLTYTASHGERDCHCQQLGSSIANRSSLHQWNAQPYAVTLPLAPDYSPILVKLSESPRESRGPPLPQLHLASLLQRGPPLS